jgi:hypothetical protein
MYISRQRNELIYICGRYSRFADCSPHNIREADLKKTLLHKLQNIISLKNSDGKNFKKTLSAHGTKNIIRARKNLNENLRLFAI